MLANIAKQVSQALDEWDKKSPFTFRLQASDAELIFSNLGQNVMNAMCLKVRPEEETDGNGWLTVYHVLYFE